MYKKIRRTKKRLVIARQRKIRRLKLLSRHPIAVPIATFFILISLTFAATLFITRTHVIVTKNSKIVIISHDHVEQTVPTSEPTVGALLKKLNIVLNQGDVVEPGTSAPINQDDFRINIYRAVPVEIVDGNTQTFTFSAATTPRSIVNLAGVTVYPEDNLNIIPTTNFLKEAAIGERVIIDRAMPVYLNLYGTEVGIHTHAKTVEALIKERNIKLAAGDTVEPALTTPITQNQLIFILRNGVKIESNTEAIAMPITTVYDSTLAYGKIGRESCRE